MEIRKKKFFSFLFILAGSFLVYGNTLSHDFIWDDLILIVDSDALRNWKNLGAFFTTPFFKLAAGMDFPHHRPMVSLLILLTSAFSGTNPFGYHLVSVVLHAAVTYLFYQFLKTMDLKEKICLLATGIFLLHPVHVEVVAWPCSTSVLMGSLCFLIALKASSRLGGLKGDARALCFLTVVGMYGVGLMSYDLVLALPAVILLYDYLLSKKTEGIKSGKVKILELSVLGLVALDFLWMRYRLASQMGGFARFQHGDPNATNVILSGTSFEPVVAALNVITRYTESLIFPLALSPEAYFRAEQWSLSAVASFVLFAVLSVFVLTRKKENTKPFLFALGWMGLTALPLLQIIFQGGLFADRYVYFTSMGFSLWLAIAVESLWEFSKNRWKFLGKRTALAALLILGLFYGLKTYDQNKIWRDDLAFWNAASILSPEKPRAHHLYGVSLMRFGYPEEAMAAFQEAIKLSPSYPHPYKGIAIALRSLGKISEADEADQVADQIYQRQSYAK